MHLLRTILLRLVGSVVVGASLLAWSGCSKQHDHASEKQPSAGSHHVHVAPHGGTLIEIGAHQFSLELVHDPVEGRLTAYILDAHAENFVRLPIQGFAIVALVSGQRQSLPMAAVANAATGETVGDTAQFSAQAEWLRGKVAFDAYIPALDIRGITFTDVRFAFRSKSGS